MSMPAVVYYTADMVRALPEDGKRYETVHGELLVSPSPRFMHQVVLQRLSLTLGRYLEGEGLEGLFSADADISWGPDLLVQPDLFVADPEEMRRTQDWSDIRTLHLVVEILSPSSLRADRFTKRRLYQEQGIAPYWVIDIENREVEVWTPDAHFPVVERERLAWRHPLAKTECVVELVKLFRPL
jgi:Uma2 family endonuclease